MAAGLRGAIAVALALLSRGALPLTAKLPLTLALRPLTAIVALTAAVSLETPPG
jgi:formaldehyde-activating enzyme involved in methanogenesis